jgi:pimeloyl-ACP methyl ester carboxylesterase
MSQGTTPIPTYLVHAYPFHSGLLAGLRFPDRLAVRCPDLRGIGKRALADGDGSVPAPSLAVYADDLARELDSRGDAAAVIGGVSIGGYVALEFAARYPDRVLGLVLANTRCTTDRPDEQQTRLDFAALADRGEIPPAADLISRLMTTATPDDARRSLVSLAAEAAPAAVAWAQRAMAGRRDTTRALANLDVPTLIIAGQLDAVTPVSDSRVLESTAKDPTFVEIAGAGHLSPAEAPAEFAAALADWVDRYATRRPFALDSAETGS